MTESQGASVSAAQALPCRHRGAPSQEIVQRIVRLVESLGSQDRLLANHGLSRAEFDQALPAAIETMRGSRSASTADRRLFLSNLLQYMVDSGKAEALERPSYGDDTVYRLRLAGYGDIAVIQKGCPDGVHSSVAWSSPEWARETYLWWLCSSLNAEPGAHVAKGMKRLQQKLTKEPWQRLDGAIFHNDLCGTSLRPCPKIDRAITLEGRRIPPPSIFLMPDDTGAPESARSAGSRIRSFPGILLSMFGITDSAVPAYVGSLDLRSRGGVSKMTITSRFGLGQSTTFRS